MRKQSIPGRFSTLAWPGYEAKPDQIVELESTTASTVKMLESDAQVVCDYMTSLFTFCMDTVILHMCFDWFQFLQTALMARFV